MKLKIDAISINYSYETTQPSALRNIHINMDDHKVRIQPTEFDQDGITFDEIQLAHKLISIGFNDFI